jgi:putative restriction endonuclease
MDMHQRDISDAEYRQAAFDHLSGLLDSQGTIDRASMSTPFFCDGKRLTLVDPQRGIHRPNVMRYLLSITTVMPAKGRRVWYADQTEVHRDVYAENDGIQYSFMGDDPLTSQNQSLKDAAEHQLPVIYFLGLKPGLYQANFPVFLSDWNPDDRKVRINFTPSLGAPATTSFPIAANDRRYAMRLVKQRLHQAQFREAVIDAYAGRCAISGLREPQLLDAAHIVPDAHEELGFPIVPNGLPLSKLHHAAFDSNLIGIDPDGRVHISKRLLLAQDGPLLEQGIKAMAGRQILQPNRPEDVPDRDRLSHRFKSFLGAS